MYIGYYKYLCLNFIVYLLINKQFMALRYIFIQLFYADSMKLMYTIQTESLKV